MSLIKKGDLSDANSARAVTNLEKDKEDAENMISVIQDFIDSSTEVLVGDSFNAVRNHLQEYINILQTRIKIADSLLAAIKKANNTMIDYMGSEDTIDTAKLESTKQTLSMVQNSYDAVNAKINSYDPDKYFASLDSLIADRASYEAQINNLKNKIDLMERLDPTDSSTYASLLESEEELTSFKNIVGGVKTISI